MEGPILRTKYQLVGEAGIVLRSCKNIFEIGGLRSRKNEGLKVSW